MNHKKFNIYDNNQTAQNELLSLRRTGGEAGYYVGFDCIDPYYTMKLGESTDWTGHPTSGKTELLLEFVINTADFYGWKWALHMPDVGTPVELLSDLMHKKTGRTFDKKYQNKITEDDIYKECPYLLEHFKIVTPEKGYRPTPLDFYQLVRDMDVQGGVIDSWKDMKHFYQGMLNEYLAEVLTERNHIMASSKKHMHQVMHPKSQNRDKNGKFPPPTAYDISGGAAPYDSGRAMIGVHRESIDTNIADVYFLKAKPRIIGKKGMCSIMFDKTKSRYYELTGNGQQRYAGPKTVQTESQEPQAKGIGWQEYYGASEFDDKDDDLPF